MPRRKSPPRLYLDPARDQWIIRDGAAFIRTGCVRKDIALAESKLKEYLGEKYTPVASDSPLIIEVLAAYAQDVVQHRVTKKNISYNLESLRRWWGDKKASDVTRNTCRAYAATKTPAAAGADLKYLRAALNHWHAEHARLAVAPIIWSPPPSSPRERWLTRQEAARLLSAARRAQHIKRLIVLGLYTGSRPGVILRLQWDQIDLSAGVMRRNRPGAAIHEKKRAPAVRLGKRILAHLRRWHRIDAGQVTYLCHFEGRRVDDPHASWKRAVGNSGLLGKVTPHTLRHTRATWLMQAGIDLWEAAGALGMTVKTLETTYGHHHPNWQRSAAEV